MVQTQSLIGAAFAVGGSYFAVESLRDILLSRTINMSYATRMLVAGSATLVGLTLVSRAAASQSRKTTKNRLSKQLMSAEELDGEQYARAYNQGYAQCEADGQRIPQLIGIIEDDAHDYEVDDYLLIVNDEVREVSGNSEMDYFDTHSYETPYHIVSIDQVNPYQITIQDQNVYEAEDYGVGGNFDAEADDYVCECGGTELRYVEYDDDRLNGFFCMNCGLSPCGVSETDDRPCTCNLDEFFHRSKSYDAEGYHAYDHRTKRAWSGMLSNAPGDAVINQVDLFHDKHILAHDDAHRAAQSWLRKNEKDQFNEIHYMLYQIDAGKWGMEYLALDTVLTFHDWSNQEMMNHGKDDSFEDWVEHEIDSHGNVSLQEWGDHEQESHTKRYGHSRPRGAFTARDAEFDGLLDPSDMTCHRCEKDGSKRGGLVTGHTGVAVCEMCLDEMEERDAESKRYTRRPIDRFTRKPKAKAGAYRSRGRRSAIKSMFASEDDDDTDLVPDRDPRRGAHDLWFAEDDLRPFTPQEAVEYLRSGDNCVWLIDYADENYGDEDFPHYDYPVEDPDDLETMIAEGVFDKNIAANGFVPSIVNGTSYEIGMWDDEPGGIHPSFYERPDWMKGMDEEEYAAWANAWNSRSRGPFTDKDAEESVFAGTEFTCDCGAVCTVDADTEIAYGPGGYDLRCGRNDDCRGDEKVLGAEPFPPSNVCGRCNLFYGNCKCPAAKESYDAESFDDIYCRKAEKTKRWTDGRYRCGSVKNHAGDCSAWSRSGSGKEHFKGYLPCEHMKAGKVDCDCILGDGVDDSLGAKLSQHPLFRKKNAESTQTTFPPIFKKATTGKIQEWRIRTEQLPDGNWAYISSHGQVGGSMTEGKGVVIKAGKQGRTIEEQANAEAAAKWKKKKETGYFESADEATNNVVVLPMTALNFKKRAHDINWPAIGQPKLDGVRCLARLEADGTISLTSRRNKLFPGMDHIREELATRLKSLGNSKGSPFPSNIVIDGELYADPKELTFQQSTGVVRRNNKTPEDLEDERKIKLNVYDCINLDDPDMDFIDRYNLMVDSLSNMDSIAMVDNTTLSDKDDVDPLHDKFVTQGYEGLMIRNVKGPYKLNGKSKHLQKFKDFQDDEFKIVGYEEGKGNYEGTVIWICEMPDGKRFRIKPNGTHEYRSKLFEEADSHIGKEITVRFFELTDGGLPRHPTGGWFRDYEAEGATTADEKCDLDYHLRCHECRLCLDCNLEADAGGNVCRFCTGESIERFDAFSISDRPVSVSFGKGTSGNAKMKAVFTDGSGDTKTTQFGYKGMSDYTKHGDEGRKSSYLARHGAKSSNENWNDPTTAGALSRWVLWNKKTLAGSKKAFKDKFNLRAEDTGLDSSIAEQGYQQSPFITEAGRKSVWLYEPDYSITEEDL